MTEHSDAKRQTREMPKEFKPHPESMTIQQLMEKHPDFAAANKAILASMDRLSKLEGADQQALKAAQDLMDAFAKSQRMDFIEQKKAKVREMILKYHDKQMMQQMEKAVNHDSQLSQADQEALSLLEQVRDAYEGDASDVQ